MTTERDSSPERVLKETLFYKVEKVGKGWSVVESCTIEGGWVHYDNSYILKTMEPIPLTKLKKQLKKQLGSVPCSTAVFEYDIVAPSDIMVVVWVGMKKRKATIPRTMLGVYTDNCNWPDEMTKEQYEKSQEY